MNARDAPTEPDANDAEGGEGDAPSRLGHFDIVGRLGAGGMGLVFEGRDKMLERRVALKLLHPGAGGVAPARLLREAQALAKLSHPNVVTVFEVGMAGNEPFVAMELVEGNTMREWMLEPHHWREVLDVFIAVGHGLAAVHALGLVHRDFKPTNILFDLRGVPKLGDFGLVGAVEDRVAPTAESALESTLTATGSVMGTPAYMAPEQRLGMAVDARADQFSFAKTLKEALGVPVPPALQSILERAMALDPGARYLDMEALLDELARVRRGNRARWIAAGSAIAVLGALALAWGLGRARSVEDPCAPPTDRLETVWSATRRDALETHLRMIDPALGPQRFAAAADVLDRGGARWMEENVDACRVARAGRQSNALLDRRMSCLDRALIEIDDTAAVLEKAKDRVSLDDAMKAVVGLPTLDDCTNVTALAELLPRPTNPVQRAEADALAKESVDIDIAVRTGGTKDARVTERASTAVSRARVLGDPESLARALRSLAGVQMQNEAGDITLATLYDAISAAAAAHDDRMVAELWSKTLIALITQRKVAEAKTLVPAADAAHARTKSTIDLRVRFLESKAQVAASAGNNEQAQALLAEAMKILDEAGASVPTSPLRPLVITIKTRAATSRGLAGDAKAMEAGLRDVIPLANAQYGADHPIVMQLHYNLYVALYRMGNHEAALVEVREAARIGEARLAPSPNLASTIESVGTTLYLLQRPSEAVPYMERAVAMLRATVPPEDMRLGTGLTNLAGAYVANEELDKAEPLLNEAIAIYEKADAPTDKMVVAYYNRGTLLVQKHRCTEARGDLEYAIDAYRKIGAVDEAYGTMFSRSDCELEARQWATAAKTTELVIAAKETPPMFRTLAHFNHGRAIWELGRRAEGVTEVRAARDTLIAEKMTTGDAIDLATKWLAAHQ